MRILLALLTMILIGISPAAAVTEQQCTTTLLVNTCGPSPVENRKVKISIRDGEKIKKKTNVDGKIILGVCPEEISEIKISGIPSGRISRTTVFDNTDTEVNATITLNICDA